MTKKNKKMKINKKKRKMRKVNQKFVVVCSKMKISIQLLLNLTSNFVCLIMFNALLKIMRLEARPDS